MKDNYRLTDSSSISPLPLPVHQALPVVAAMGLISFVTTVLLLFRLCHLFIRWRKQGQQGVNQILILIFNLILADVQQAFAFLLNAQWLRINAIQVGSGMCWAQGWFIATGDLASGIFTLVIALHAFADVIYDYRLKPKAFFWTIAGCWVFIYGCAILGVALHPSDYFARTGPWCFINNTYASERLYFHYLWIIIAELAVAVIYAATFYILNRRVRECYYADMKTAQRAQAAAKMMVAYPIVYCICTLPIVSARLASSAGKDPGYIYLCIGGAMITSNGWLDVLLYTLTRSSYIVQGEAPEAEAPVLETFRMPGQNLDNITFDSGLWKQRNEMLGSRPGSRDGPWGRIDTTSESIRIQQRASMSLRMLESERIRQGDAEAHVNEMPRFFERIYKSGADQLASPRSPHSPLSPQPSPSPHQPSSPFLVQFPSVAPVEKE
ncbi:hypothetical protein AMS68_004827 [Peltaster fructicola]|uniref:G-protein coupled receptors family 1 profile domain-containing protein n=1 Tax=Peltaster fructicola TaxID=286661 RepID=A0A6H0XY14_9PEZI|nr:hypothetical protein AMS68_004827 [Peltaster fructicola]